MTTHTYPEGTLHDIEELCPCTTTGRCSLHHAAPDLLAALQDIRDTLDDLAFDAGTDDCVEATLRDIARDVIRKVTESV